ncbi:MAG: serine/threonine protein kinase [Pirellulales bacterium]|nr:serine/threonine protein kinase [Pirellulales bacterium]
MIRAADPTLPDAEPAEQLLAALMDEYLISLEHGAPLDLDEMIAAHPALEADIREFAASVEQLHRAAQESPLPGEATEPALESISPATQRLGDYRIVRELGRGGMGIVYEAEQLSLARRVALKVLPFAAMWDRKQLARFQNEARAAAQLHHPHIVPVFGVGQDRGVHYYAMQMVSGQSLDKLLADLRRGAELRSAETAGPGGTTASPGAATMRSLVETADLSPARRGAGFRAYCRAVAELGVQAAEALQYAHDCGVIHRDVKPSNLLLDDRNAAWITDFGLARIQGDVGVTATGDVVGTLRYMSPEQAAGQQALIDPRTDVYSLGATLYELLTLAPAFPGEDRREVLRAVIERDPLPLRELAPEIPVDLETIVLCALSKSREDRYATAAEMADDLRRFLEDKPTRARRPTVIDRATNLVRRHRRATAALAGFLLVVAVLSTTGAALLSREQARTAAALEDAQTSLEKARRVVDRFGGQFVHELERLPGSEPLRRAVLADTLDYYRDFIAQASDDPHLNADLAATQYQAGVIAGRLGDFAAANDFLHAAAEEFGQLAVRAPRGERRDEYLARQAASWNSLALVEVDHGDLSEAQRLYRLAVDVQRPLAAGREASAESRRQYAQIRANRGLLARRQGDATAAATDFAAAIAVLERLVAEAPASRGAKYDLALALNNRSFVEQASDLAAARASCESAVALLRELIDQSEATSADLVRHQADVALCLNNLGAIRGHMQDDAAAATVLREAATIQESLLRRAPAVVQHRSDLAITLNNLGQAETRAGRPAAARQAFQRAAALFEQLTHDYPGEPRFASASAGVLNNQAMADELAGDWSAALAKYESAIERQRAAWGQGPERSAFRDSLNKHYVNYARCLRAAGRVEDAAAACVARRELWPDDGRQLYRIALELVATAEAAPSGADAMLAEAAAALVAAADVWNDADGPLAAEPLPSALRDRVAADLVARLEGAKR